MNRYRELPGPYDQLRRSAAFAGCRVVTARGELDLTTVAPVAKDLIEARTGVGQLCLIVDLSEVTFADGSILQPLCDAWTDSLARRGWVRVVYTRPAIGLVFRAGGLDGRFPGYASARDAWRGAVGAPGAGSRVGRFRSA